MNHAPHDSPTRFGTSRRRILLAEDDADMREAIAALLDSDGYDVTAVCDGAEMLEALAEAAGSAVPFDLIVTDIQMPGMNGVNVVEELRAEGWPQPVVVVSAFDQPAVRERLARVDRCAFVAKPFAPATLQDALAHVTAP